MAKFITFKGRKYRLCLPGPYYRAENWGDGESSLHRAKWAAKHGPIPEGYDVHHKDEDRLNNKLSNLELIERSAHRRLHIKQRIARGEMSPPSVEALRLAALWHASPEGLAWHSENGKRSWDSREWHTLKCQHCGAEYQSPWLSRSRFCHSNCKMAARRQRLR